MYIASMVRCSSGAACTMYVGVFIDCDVPVEVLSAKLHVPKPEGRLSTVVSSSSIAGANKEVAVKTEKPESKHGAYKHFTPEEN